ncbi:MAG: F0F1 ATP synthase subunit epsilon [Anaerolineae bacterium]|nr:F0F1 ATP synthase subunit epsilon [Anaerolineae bacterium]MDW8099937.1 F0F1 ATP synthase subunit epsilon [Anaerolineae bacterium]
MATIRCEVVTPERVVYSDDVNMVIAPGVEGELGILPHHAPLMTALTYGQLVIRKEGEEDVLMAIGGGFMEVLGDRVTILADTAERAEEIDEERALAARRRAEERLRQRQREDVDFARAEAALRRSLVRLRVVERARQRRGRPSGPSQGE